MFGSPTFNNAICNSGRLWPNSEQERFFHTRAPLLGRIWAVLFSDTVPNRVAQGPQKWGGEIPETFAQGVPNTAKIGGPVPC